MVKCKSAQVNVLEMFARYFCCRIKTTRKITRVRTSTSTEKNLLWKCILYARSDRRSDNLVGVPKLVQNLIYKKCTVNWFERFWWRKKIMRKKERFVYLFSVDIHVCRALILQWVLFICEFYQEISFNSFDFGSLLNLSKRHIFQYWSVASHEHVTQNSRLYLSRA